MERNFIRIIETLLEHRVRFVLIGGIAANLLGSPSLTRDVDICYDRADDGNLRRLTDALREMKARLRGASEDVPFILDAEILRRGDSFTFTTAWGSLDILGTPSGTNGFSALKANAHLMDMGFGLQVWVCSLDDLMRMKAAAGRDKDLIELHVLGALRDELDGVPEDEEAG